MGSEIMDAVWSTYYSLRDIMLNEDACGDINGEDNAKKRLFVQVNQQHQIPYNTFVHIDMPASVYEICNRTMTSLAITEGSYMSLHIRRNDAINQCNTSIKRIVEYLHCLTYTSEQLRLNNWRSRLLIFTDETDSNYLTELVNSIEAIRPVNYTERIVPIHVDPIIDRIIYDASHVLRIPSDNYYNFVVGQQIQKKSTLQIEFRRRDMCGYAYHNQKDYRYDSCHLKD